MHELSLCRNLLDQALVLANQHHAQCIKTINVTMGPLCTADSHHLQSTFSYASSGTIADKARLIVNRIPMTIRCLDCMQESQVVPDRMICEHCGSQHTQLINGSEIMLHDVELIT